MATMASRANRENGTSWTVPNRCSILPAPLADRPVSWATWARPTCGATRPHLKRSPRSTETDSVCARAARGVFMTIQGVRRLFGDPTNGRKRAITIDMLARMAPVVRATRKGQPKLATKLGA
eukprot:350363-Pyramimonas_sp.AAC.1